MGDQLDPDRMRTLCARRASTVTGTDRQDDGLLQRESHLIDDMQVEINRAMVLSRSVGRRGLKQMVHQRALVVAMIAVDPIMCVERNGRNAHQQEHRGHHAQSQTTGRAYRPIGKQGAQSSHDLRSMPKQATHLKCLWGEKRGRRSEK